MSAVSTGSRGRSFAGLADRGGKSGSISTLFPFQTKVFCAFKGTKPPIVSEVTADPLTAADRRRKMAKRGILSRFMWSMEGK